jgi:hypothetical protein
MFLFKANRPRDSVAPFLRRICDLTTDIAPLGDQSRTHNRYHRVLPALLCPWEDDAPVADSHLFALTKDISDDGLGLTLPQRLQAERVAVGLWLPAGGSTPWFFLGDVKTNFALGGGFWLLGVRLTEVAHEESAQELEPLRTLAQRLLPHRAP